MTALEIFYSYSVIYWIVTFYHIINFVVKYKKSLEVVDAADPEVRQKAFSNVPAMLRLIFSICWTVIGWFTPLRFYFICLSIIGITRLIISFKTTDMEKSKRLFFVAYLFKIIVTSLIIYELVKNLTWNL